MSLLTLMGEAAGAMMLVDRLMENPKMRKGTGRKKGAAAPAKRARAPKRRRAVKVARAAAKPRRPKSKVRRAAKRAAKRTVVKTTTRTVVRSNPVRHGYDVTANGAQLATFKTRKHALQYGQAFADAYGVQVKVDRS